MKLQKEFYLRDDVVMVARELLGKFLMTNIDGKLTGGMITETEAYAGITDKASHAYGGRRTPRTEIMFGQGGFAYVYLCYGVHYLFNVVTNVQDVPHAVLIRGVEPVDGLEEIYLRIKKNKLKGLADGPGKLTKALGITMDLNKKCLTGNQIWIEDRGVTVPNKNILVSKRIGIDYAEEDALLPYRFNLIK